MSIDRSHKKDVIKMMGSDMKIPMDKNSSNAFSFPKVGADKKSVRKGKRKNGYQKQMKRAQGKIKRGMIQL